MRKLLGKLIAWATPPAQPAAVKPPRQISQSMLVHFQHKERVQINVEMPKLPPGVIPASAKQDAAYMALDASAQGVCSYANEQLFGMGFMGYPLLSELTQRSEYRAPSETTAQEMTRAWIRVRAQGDGDLSDKIARIEDELKRHKVQDVFRLAALHDGFFGRGQIFINIKGSLADDDLRKLPLVIDKSTIAKGSLLGFTNIEPIWTSPYAYNADNPIDPHFYKPSSWFVLGKQTHASRLMTIISRPVPDILKPAYNFGGMSMTQLMQPYVDAWLKTRDSVSAMISNYSTSGIKTDMSDVLAGGEGEDIDNRADLFVAARDNRGLMMLDNSDATNPEEFFQFNAPLTSLDALQAQSQEHMAAPSHTPLVKLLGITPTGLNANSEGEIDVYYDYTHAQQEVMFTPHLNTVLQVIQLDVWGEIDPAIGFEYVPLKQLDGKELAEVRKSDADAAAAYITAGVISPEEERARLAADPNSGYDGLAAEDTPELPGDDVPAGELDD